MKPTIKDVALRAKVSIATVSRIVNNLSGYSEETRERVLDSIKEMGYRPNAIARSLVNKKTNTIGVLLPSVSSKFAAELLRGIENRAHSLEHSVIVCNTRNDGTRTMEYLQVLAEKQVEGIIFASEWLKDIYAENIIAMHAQVVLVSTISYKYQIPYVKVDDKQAAYRATQYLIEKGHRKIGLISGRMKDRIAGLPRIEGYRQALTDHDIPIVGQRIAYGDFLYASGYRSMEDLFEKAPDITAVFATSDEMALGALSCAYRRGVRVPVDLSIVGYDDTQDAVMAIPPLTTVHQPIYEMGERAAQILLERSGVQESIIMPHYIVERESVKEIA